jgi:hypothetical protein
MMNQSHQQQSRRDWSNLNDIDNEIIKSDEENSGEDSDMDGNEGIEDN